MPYMLNARHGLAVPWLRDQALEGKYIGVELEIAHQDGMQRLLDLLPEPENDADRPSCEPDGSLRAGVSVEIVFPPIAYDSLKSKESFFAKALGALRDGNAEALTNNYGLHLNVNSADWTTAKRRLFCAIINWLPSSWITRIGGRVLNGYSMRNRHKTLEDYQHGGMNGQARGMTAIRNGGNRIELRFAKATTDHDRVVMLTRFIEAVEAMAETQLDFMEALWANIPMERDPWYGNRMPAGAQATAARKVGACLLEVIEDLELQGVEMDGLVAALTGNEPINEELNDNQDLFEGFAAEIRPAHGRELFAVVANLAQAA